MDTISPAPTFSIPQELGHALAEQRFALAAQPIYGLGTGGPVAHEMLIRLVSLTGDLIPAGKFLRDAQDRNAMPVIDICTLQLMREKILPYMPKGSQCLFSINVSALSLLYKPYTERLFSGTWEHLAQKLVFEIPVQDFTAHPDVIPVLKAMRAKGFRIGVDYFGNRSMLEAAKKLQIDILKFDFFKDGAMAKDGNALGGLIEEANGKGFVTVAARVETETQCNAAKIAGFQMFQGNYFGEACWPCTAKKMSV